MDAATAPAKTTLARFLAANPFPNPLTDGLFYREKMRAIWRVSPAEPLRRILEVGGGRSGLTTMLYPGAEVVTIDIDPLLGAQRPAATRGAPFVCADARRLPFADAAFDAVTLFDVLEHVPEDAAAAGECLRVLRPGGYVLLSTPDDHWRYPFYGFMRPVCPPERQLMDEWGHVRRGYGAARLDDLFGGPAEGRASFVNALTAFYHDVSFSRLGRRKRRALYALAAPLAALGYVAHRPAAPGAETAYRWRKPA